MCARRRGCKLRAFKLKEQHHKSVLQINLNKTEYVVAGRKARDLSVGDETVVAAQRCNYLEIITGKADCEVIKCVWGNGEQLKRDYILLFGVRQFPNRVKRLIYKTIVYRQ